ncbi:MAG: hypothetical protein NTY37_09275 [Methanothrix sp.]|nr:hypothetical protein [Methanothrix sp.]
MVKCMGNKKVQVVEYHIEHDRSGTASHLERPASFSVTAWAALGSRPLWKKKDILKPKYKNHIWPRLFLVLMVCLIIPYLNTVDAKPGENGTKCYSFRDLGYNTTTYERGNIATYDGEDGEAELSMNFNSPGDFGGYLNLHFSVSDTTSLKVFINEGEILPLKEFQQYPVLGSSIEAVGRFPKDYLNYEINIPSGIIRDGPNTLKISLPESPYNILGYYDITIFEDSSICINQTPASDRLAGTGVPATIEDDEKEAMNGSRNDLALPEAGVWLYDALITEESGDTRSGLLALIFKEKRLIGGFNASVFETANTVPEELSGYEIILANIGDFIGKYMPKENIPHYALIMPTNPVNELSWDKGTDLLVNTSFPGSYSIDGLEDVVVPAGSFICLHKNARDENYSSESFLVLSSEEWWDTGGKGLIKAKYERRFGIGKIGNKVPGIGAVHGGTKWEYSLNNTTESAFPLKYV